MKRIGTALLLMLIALAAFVWISDPTKLKTSSASLTRFETGAMSGTEEGIALFGFGDFGGLSSDTLRTSAAPWKLAVSALALQEAAGDVTALKQIDIAAIYRRFGFHSPTQIANWPPTLARPDLSKPVGINTGLAKHAHLPIAVTIGNTGCAACHSAVTYREDGTPDTTKIWLGMPNSSINLEAYTAALHTAFRTYGHDDAKLFEAVEILFPETGWSERQTLRFAILPMLQQEMDERKRTIGRLVPFVAGLPGATNGLDALRNRLGLIPEGTVVDKSVFNSVPELGGRLWRRSFLNTGSYVPPGVDPLSETVPKDLDENHLKEMASIVAYFTVPSMGVSAEVAEAHIADAEAVLRWLQDYEPQRFPGKINRHLLTDGRSVYADNCSQCHGVYNQDLTKPELVAFPNWQGDIGTDRRRLELTGENVAAAVNSGHFGRYISARSTGTYAAPPLTGIWASAPYLHNGSVPTLWHLMRPDKRPERFVVGGHALDMTRVGLRGSEDKKGGWMPPPDYEPWALSAEIDVSQYGLGNEGHERPFSSLSEDDKAALLEYLKLL